MTTTNDHTAQTTHASPATRGELRDGWIYSIERIPGSSRFRATVIHPYGDALTGGVPWPIEDPRSHENPSYPVYETVEEAVRAAEAYVNMLADVHGYPDPDKMSARGFRPALWG